MKKITIILAIVLFTTTSFANDSVCRKFAKIANSAMSARQAGVSIIKMMDILPKKDSALKDLTESIILNAYSISRVSSEKAKTFAITEYESMIYKSCMENSK